MAYLEEYWKRNLKIMGVLLGVWFFVSYFCGILIVDLLNKVSIACFFDKYICQAPIRLPPPPP